LRPVIKKTPNFSWEKFKFSLRGNAASLSLLVGLHLSLARSSRREERARDKKAGMALQYLCRQNLTIHQLKLVVFLDKFYLQLMHAADEDTR